jgi:Bacterial CdiA-CT RNAse A domain
LPIVRSSLALIVVGLLLTLATCRGSGVAQPRASQAASPQPAASSTSTPQSSAAAPSSGSARHARRRDLSVDESLGGHTLARHVGKTDAELADRLRRERQISAASTYTDRTTAEAVVGIALDTGGSKLAAWQRRSGRRPNFVLHHVDRAGAAIGRSLFRGAREGVPCERAVVVLKWDDRADRFFVLTSYPDCSR